VIADVLMERHAELEELVRQLLAKGATGDLRAAQTLIRYLDQAYGRPSDTPAGASDAHDDLPQLSREERARMIAELRQQLGGEDAAA
jgi:hypothetical protein